MLDAIKWWLSSRRHTSIHGWMKAQYTRSELERLVAEATDADLVRPPNPLAKNTYLGGGLPELRKTVTRLYRHYGDQIWSACYRAAASGRPTNGYDLYSSWIEAFSTLSMAFQAINPEMFEEMLVRHALRQCAIELLAEAPQPQGHGTAR